MGVEGKEVPGPQLRKFIFPNKMFILHIKQRLEGARLLLAQQGAGGEGGEGCVASPATGLQFRGSGELSPLCWAQPGWAKPLSVRLATDPLRAHLL